MTTFTTEDRIEFEKVPEPPEPTWEEKWKPWLYSLRQDYDCVQKSCLRQGVLSCQHYRQNAER